LKSANARRIIPLFGISLKAFRANPDGFPRYADNPSLSDTVNKFLRENKLLESDKHTMYSLRHSFEDRLLGAGTDERIRRDLMGHRLTRERYGKGADLVQLQRVLQAIAV
jgi:integrase